MFGIFTGIIACRHSFLEDESMSRYHTAKIAMILAIILAVLVSWFTGWYSVSFVLCILAILWTFNE